MVRGWPQGACCRALLTFLFDTGDIINRARVWLLALGAAWVLAACGGSDGDSDTLPNPAELCGSIGLQPKVVNGANCGQPERSPVILLNIQSSSGATSVCSGTLITANKILTAAHCLPAGTKRVLAGRWNADGTVVGVAASRWVSHPDFSRDPTLLSNDAAVVFLSSGLPNPTMGVLVSEATAAGQGVNIAGWGAPGFELAVGYAKITQVNATSVGYVYDGKLSNTCSGDSGGPAYRTVGGRQGVVGITSSGTVAGCGAGDESLFTNVQGPSVINFIRAHAPEAAYL
jgi:secreted trypsin-like serine protease